MARQHGHYYRKRRVGDTVVSEHIGTGPFADLVEQLDRAERLKRKAQAEQYRRMVRADHELQQEINDIGAIVRNLTTLVMVATGHHTHRRQWRKSEMAEQVTLHLGANADDIGMTIQELRALIERIDSGKPSKADREALAKCLDAVPNFAALLGDMSARVVEHMIGKMNTQPTTRQAAGVHFLNQRNALGYKTATPIERSLIENVVVCWFRLQYVELQFSLHTLAQHETKTGLYWDKRLSAAQRRYLRAVESLERVRRLMRNDGPSVAVQMNINEVNQLA